MARNGDARVERVTDTDDPTRGMCMEGWLRLLSCAVEQSPNLVIITDASGSIEYANRGFTATTGYSPEEFMGKRVGDLGKLSAEEENRLWETIASGGEWRGEFQSRKKSGEILWISGSISPIQSPDGVITHFLGCGEDITKRKRAEEALRESEEKWRSLTENAPDFVITVDGDGKILSTNRTVVDFSVAEVVGNTVYTYVPEEYHDGVRQTLRDVFQTRTARRIEVAGVGPFGSTSRYEVRLGPIVLDGRVVAATWMATDVTDRRQAEEALRESEGRFRSAFEHAATGMALVAPDGRLLRVNRTCCEALGYSEQELTSLTWQALTHPDDLDATLNQVRRVLAGEEDSFQLEKRFIHKRGHVMWGHLTSSLLRDADGSPVHFITQIEDITERKRAEEALRESEMRFRQVVDHAADAICVTDSEGKFIDANPAACDSLGYTREELLTMSVVDVADGVSLGMLREARDRVMSGAPSTIEAVHRRKDGSTFPVEIRIGLLDIDGRKHILGLARDMSERKRAEQALRESQERYRELVENINDVIYAVDGSGRITYISPVIEQLSGYSPAEVIGRSFAQFVHPEDLAPLKEGFLRNLAGNPEPNEYRVLAKSGEVRWVRTFSRPILEEDRVVGLRGVLTDVTERKRAEEVLQAAREELESRVERRMRRDNLYGLTFRELTVLHLLADGRSDREIAAELVISPRTANKHVENILNKMGASCRTEAGVRAVREGLVD